MKHSDDILPEEQEEQHKELITLVQQAYQQSLASTASVQEQAIQRVGKRLMMMEGDGALSEEALPEQLNMEQASVWREPETGEGRPRRRKRAMIFFNTLAAVLIVCLLIGASVVLFTNRLQSMTGTSVGPGDMPATEHVEAGGLAMSMSVTPGPYFLSEMVVADMALTNHTATTFMLEGGGNRCYNPVLRLYQTSGESPHYTLPLYTGVYLLGCSSSSAEIKPGQTITVQQYEPLTSSGHVTLTARAIFLKMEGGYSTRFTSPLDGHWPFLQIQVNSHIPSGRLFSLHLKGSQVLIDAPAAVHLVYQFTESCDTDSSGIGNNSWEPISTHVLKAPGNLVGCATKDVHWQYAVSAAGYAIVGGEYPA